MILDNGMSDSYNSQVQALGVGIMAKVPTLMWGPPGVGKSSVVDQIARFYKIHNETVMANIREASDFAGLPAVIQNEVHFAPPSWVKNLQRAAESGKQTLTFYDEISTARPEVRAAMLRPILEGVVGDEKLPDDVITIGAANHPDIAAGGWDIDAPTANRFLHIDWDVTVSDMAYGLARGWPPVMLPLVHRQKWERVEEAKRLMAAYILARPDHIKSGTPDLMGSNKASDYAFPSSRSLEFASILYGFAKSVKFVNPLDNSKHNISDMALERLMTGIIGEAAGHDFLTFVNDLDLPNPQDLLNRPSSFVVPQRSDILNAIIYSVEYEATKEQPITADTWTNWGEILVAVLDAGYSDVAYSSGKIWMRNRPQGVNIPRNQVSSFKNLFEKLDQAI